MASRIDCSIGAGSWFDDNCIVGFDLLAKTFFFVSGREDRAGNPRVWLGTAPGEFATLGELEMAMARAYAGQAVEFDRGTRRSLVGAALAEIDREEKAGFIAKTAADALRAQVAQTEGE